MVDLRCVVSIPFKRESVSKDKKKEIESENFKNVSIPFKRESVSKVNDELKFSKGYNL